jgi:hypothetical protein
VHNSIVNQIADTFTKDFYDFCGAITILTTKGVSKQYLFDPYPNPSRNIYPPVLRIRIRIRIHQIHMFLGLLDPDPLVRGIDPDPDSCIIKQK